MLKEYLNEKKVIIETNLQEKLALYKNPSMLSEAMNYSVMNGGKRLRPIIMYMMCDLFNKNYEEIQDVAIALEFIHCYSLVHDDLPAMDNDMYRRGKLTTHIKFDEATAILAGDALLTEAFLIIAKSDKIKQEKKALIIAKLSEYAGFYGMIGGQYIDMESENHKIEYETLQYIHANKTGKLLTAAIELPLISLGINEGDIQRLVKYSELMGIAFQIKDDILDIEGEFEKTGKKSSDVTNQKTTYPSLFGLERSKELLNEYIQEAKKILVDNYDSNQVLVELTEYFGSRGE